jgi:phospholipid/cholesterol/gamma-HCH transport system substrate-binding protein
MKISRELKIGIVAIVTIGILIWGWNFLKGINIFKTTDTYYAVYNDIKGLIESGVVMLNGYKVGNVGKINFDKNNANRIIVEIRLEEKVRLPENTILLIKSSSIVSGIKDLKIILGNGPGYHTPGDTLIGAVESELTDIIEPLKNKLGLVLVRLDSTLASVNNVLDEKTQKQLKSAIADLSETTAGLSASVAPGGKLDQSFDNLASLTGNLQKSNENITQTLQNLSSISDSLQKADIKSFIEKADQTFEKLDALLAMINAGEGTAGQLVTNDSLYRNLNSAIGSLDSLLVDLKKHPKRYVHFSVFGKKEGK